MRSDKLGEVAAEFKAMHTVKRARRVGSVHAIIRPQNCDRGSPKA